MADQYIGLGPDGVGGKKVQAYENTVNGNVVEAQAMVVVDVSGAPIGVATESTLSTIVTTAAFNSRINTLGQKAMAASTPVVLASDQSAIPVTGTFWQATQPVVGNRTNNTAIPGTTNLGALVAVASTLAPTYTDGNLVALSTDLTGALRISGGGGSGGSNFGSAFPATGTAIGASDGTNMQGLLVESSSNKNLRVGLFAGANQASVSAGGALKVDNSGQTQPISGTITANIGTSGSLALDATLTGGTQKTKLVDSGGTNVATVSAGGALKVDNSAVTQPVKQNSNIDATNSTTSLLGAGATYTGTGVDVSAYASIHVFYFADQAGTLNLQFSSDNVNWDNTLAFPVSASTGDHVSIGPQAQYFRVQYVNGGTIQGTFRLQTYYQSFAAHPPVVSLGSVPNANGDALVTQSLIIGKTTAGGGSLVPAKVNPSGSLTVDGSGVTQPVSGTVTANAGTGTFSTSAAQSGTWTVQPGNTANTTAWRIEGIKSDASAIGTTRPVFIGGLGSDGSIHSLTTDALGNQYVIPMNDFYNQHSNATITTSGSIVFGNCKNKDVVLFVNVKHAPTGSSPQLFFTLQDIDPDDQVTAVGTAVSGPVITGITSHQIYFKSNSNFMKLSWTISGSTPSFTQVSSTIVSKPGLNAVSLGNIAGKAIVGVPGSVVTTAVTADQVIATYTVTTGKTLFLQQVDCSAKLTTFASTATDFGTASLETPSGTKIATWNLVSAGTANTIRFAPAEPVAIASGTVVRLVCTPSATTSFTWYGNLIGFER